MEKKIKIKERDLMLSGIGSRTKQQQVELPSDLKKKKEKRINGIFSSSLVMPASMALCKLCNIIDADWHLFFLLVAASSSFHTGRSSHNRSLVSPNFIIIYF